MNKSKNKLYRYRNLFKRITNWPQYFISKITGFQKPFIFNIKDFEEIEVDKSMMGTFREIFLDDIYFRFIPHYVFKNKTELLIFDIGANVGFFSLSAFMKFPKAEIHAFEPHPYNFQLMKEKSHLFKNYLWHLHQKAMGGDNGEMKLSTTSMSAYTSMATVFDSQADKEVFTAKSISLESFLIEQNIKNIDFIKMDCEGAEYSIIYNLPTSSFEKINAMCIETHKGLNEEETTYALNKYLIKMNFNTKWLDEGSTGYIWAWRNNS